MGWIKCINAKVLSVPKTWKMPSGTPAKNLLVFEQTVPSDGISTWCTKKPTIPNILGFSPNNEPGPRRPGRLAKRYLATACPVYSATATKLRASHVESSALIVQTIAPCHCSANYSMIMHKIKLVHNPGAATQPKTWFWAQNQVWKVVCLCGTKINSHYGFIFSIFTLGI